MSTWLTVNALHLLYRVVNKPRLYLLVVLEHDLDQFGQILYESSTFCTDMSLEHVTESH